MPSSKPYALNPEFELQVDIASSDATGSIEQLVAPLQQGYRPRPYQLRPNIEDSPHPSVHYAFHDGIMDEADKPFYGLI